MKREISKELCAGLVLKGIHCIFFIIIVILSLYAVGTHAWYNNDNSAFFIGLAQKGYSFDLRSVGGNCFDRQIYHTTNLKSGVACGSFDYVCTCTFPLKAEATQQVMVRGNVTTERYTYENCTLVARNTAQDCEVYDTKTSIKKGGIAAMFFLCLGIFCIIAGFVLVLMSSWFFSAIAYGSAIFSQVLGLIIWGAAFSTNNVYYKEFDNIKLSLGISGRTQLAAFFLLFVPLSLSIAGGIMYQWKGQKDGEAKTMLRRDGHTFNSSTTSSNKK